MIARDWWSGGIYNSVRTRAEDENSKGNQEFKLNIHFQLPLLNTIFNMILFLVEGLICYQKYLCLWRAIRILKIVLCIRAVFGELLQIRSILFQCLYFLVISIRKHPYLSQMADNWKNKGTLLSRTLKVRENKVPSEFLIVCLLAEIRTF